MNALVIKNVYHEKLPLKIPLVSIYFLPQCL